MLHTQLMQAHILGALHPHDSSLYMISLHQQRSLVIPPGGQCGS